MLIQVDFHVHALFIYSLVLFILSFSVDWKKRARERAFGVMGEQWEKERENKWEQSIQAHNIYMHTTFILVKNFKRKIYITIDAACNIGIFYTWVYISTVWAVFTFISNIQIHSCHSLTYSLCVVFLTSRMKWLTVAWNREKVSDVCQVWRCWKKSNVVLKITRW